ncbi:MAG: methylated-DNA--[protein]-cysteine S-methyltransferase [Nitrospira sp.]|nr:methylated-DNA--[protein]-cysteine S-methyltransferase [Nitrospira sp.]
MNTRTLIFKSRWGWMGLAESPAGIASIVLSKPSKLAVQSTLGSSKLGEQSSSPRLRAAKKQLIEYMAGKRTSFTFPLDLSDGTAFQRRVWRTLQSVPYGTLSSYQNLAARVGGKQYARAVGGAVGSNPLPIVVPCHRIVAQDGSIGGFSGGLPTKRKLLALEGSLSQLARAGGSRHKVGGGGDRSTPTASSLSSAPR